MSEETEIVEVVAEEQQVDAEKKAAKKTPRKTAKKAPQEIEPEVQEVQSFDDGSNGQGDSDETFVEEGNVAVPSAILQDGDYGQRDNDQRDNGPRDNGPRGKHGKHGKNKQQQQQHGPRENQQPREQLPALSLHEMQITPINDIKAMAEQYGLTDYAGFSKHQLIFELLKTHGRRGGPLLGRGVLEILPDGFGFLRSPLNSYQPAPDDIYVSPSQIRRFGIRTGDFVILKWRVGVFRSKT
jgi:hypothetical protein